MKKKIFNYNELQLIGQSVLFNNSYLHSVSQTVLLAESSLRFPIAECLERRIHASEIFLEYQHPLFKNRRIDIFWRHENEDNAFELKFVKSGFRSKESIQRVFNDIIRLVYCSKEGMNSYFLACGKTDDYNAEFKRINHVQTEQDIINRNFKSNNSIYGSLLSFDQDNPHKEVCLSGFSNYFNCFCEQYKCRGGKKLENDLNCITSLVYHSNNPSQLFPYTVSIWEIQYSE